MTTGPSPGPLWVSGGHPQGEQGPQGRQANQTGKTNETRFEVEALEPGTLYNFSVWAERNNVASSTRSLRASTAPDPVTITSCSSASGGYKVVVTWSCPPGGYEAFELEVGRQRVSQPPSSCGKGVSMSGLGPAKSYPAVVTTLWDGMRAQSASVTCHTESAALLRCTPGNIRPIIHLKCTAQWLLVYSQCLHHRHCQFKVFSLLRREVISAWSVLCTVNKPN